MVVLHDRRIPGTMANIDHLVVGLAGVWVIDAKHYEGKIEKRDVGRFLRRDDRLYVAGHDRSNLVDGVVRQAQVVRTALSGMGQVLRVIPVLCFVGGDWGLFTKPFRLDEVIVIWPKALIKEIAAAPPAHDADVPTIADHLAMALPAA